MKQTTLAAPSWTHKNKVTRHERLPAPIAVTRGCESLSQ